MIKLKFSFFFIIISNCLIAQCDSSKLCYYNKDTLSYFRQVFEVNKSNFANKPLEKLISALEVKPIEYFPSKIFMRIDSCKGLKLYFTQGFSYNRRTRTSIKLEIRFENLILEDSCVEQLKKDKGFWLYSTRQFYGNRIVKDFQFIEMQY